MPAGGGGMYRGLRVGGWLWGWSGVDNDEYHVNVNSTDVRIRI